jgi:hypothetical protein
MPCSGSQCTWSRYVTGYLSPRAEEKGVSVSQLVNELLRRDIEIIESLK